MINTSIPIFLKFTISCLIFFTEVGDRIVFNFIVIIAYSENNRNSHVVHKYLKEKALR